MLLILAGITIAILTGDNGILTKATESSETSEREKTRERIGLSVQAANIEGRGQLEYNNLNEELKKEFGEDNYKILNPIDVLDIPKVVVSEDMEFRVINGQVLKKFFAGDIAMILNKNNELLAIYKDYNDGYVKPYKMFV